MGIWYCTREDVMSATDVKASARMGAEIDRDIESGARAAELLVHRQWYPWTGVRYFDWPGVSINSWSLWLDEYWLQSVTALTAGGTVITDYFLEPVNYGPPFDQIELNRGGSAAWNQTTTSQRAISVAGLWGFGNEQSAAGTITAGVNAAVTTVPVSDSSVLGVGSLLTIGAERLVVTGKSLVTTGTTLGADLLSSNGQTAVTVASGALVNVGEKVTIDTEVMQVVDKTGNVLSVKRAVDGSVLATHTTGATVYAPRSLTVLRGATGTTAASALISAPVTAWVAPGPVRDLNIAYATASRLRRSGGFKKADADAIDDLECQVRTAYGRLRSGVV